MPATRPITQVAFTLANGFTIIEYYLARGLSIDGFARNLSYFFSNGMDPEYAVIGRVARRIFAVALRDLYQASEGSCKLKYHIQTSGRSLHAMEIDFNDIRTTFRLFMRFMTTVTLYIPMPMTRQSRLLQKSRYAGHWRFS